MQGSVVSCMKDSSVVKKQFFSNNIPTSEEEEDEHEVSKTEKELFFEISPYCDLSVVSNDVVWPCNTFLLCQNHLSIQTPPPEL